MILLLFIVDFALYWTYNEDTADSFMRPFKKGCQNMDFIGLVAINLLLITVVFIYMDYNLPMCLLGLNMALYTLSLISTTFFGDDYDFMSESQVFEGFSNPGVGTLAFLLVVAAALKETKIVETFVKTILKDIEQEWIFILVLLVVSALLSAFLLSLVLLVILVPIVEDLCE